MLVVRDDGLFYDEEMRAWVRPSQTKIQYPKAMQLDPAMLTLDILRTSHMSTPSQISAEIIINLAENGVPHSVFVQLLKISIREMVKGLTTWDGPDAMLNLWTNVERAGGVLTGRRAREAVGEARVRGFSNRSPEEESLEDDDAEEDGFEADDVPRSAPWWTDQISGCPSTLEETVMVLLDSGFHPESSPILREKLKHMVVKKIENKTDKLRFVVDQSCVAFAVAGTLVFSFIFYSGTNKKTVGLDPFGVLGPEEVQIKSSKRNLKLDDGLTTDIILGDVLVRSCYKMVFSSSEFPFRSQDILVRWESMLERYILLNDVSQLHVSLTNLFLEVKAVEHPSLRNYTDVIVFSIQGLRRLIDWLAGGNHPSAQLENDMFRLNS
jgi:hypothetical protein